MSFAVYPDACFELEELLACFAGFAGARFFAVAGNFAGLNGRAPRLGGRRGGTGGW